MANNPALILGMFETGLGVGRSLGRQGIKVFGFDHKKDIGFYSKYIKAKLCEHPIYNENKLVQQLIDYSKSQAQKPVIFITSDYFLYFFAKNYYLLAHWFL